MIAHLHGRLTRLSGASAVIECQGVGYEVQLAAATVAALPPVGEVLRMPVHLSVREDAMTLYGFGGDDEKELFGVLLQVSGVGPKVAQNLVSSLPPAVLVEAIATGDVARLSSVPGIGKRLAQRLTVELADKIGERGWSQAAAEPSAAQDLVEALLGLGFTAVEARQAARAAIAAADDGTPLEQLVKLALKEVAR